MNPAPAIDRKGLLAASGAFFMWGLFPLFWVLLKAVPALEIIAHRVVWCALFVVSYLLWRDGIGWLRVALAGPKVLLTLIASSILISINWGLYIWAVTHGHVVEASLGYFINPLVNVLIGVLLLHERLNRAQWASVALAAIGVLWLTVQHGGLPWIALTLAFSFAFYGLLRKQVAVESVPGLGIESLLLTAPALLFLFWREAQGLGQFGHAPLRIDLLLVVGGALTALPLIGFAYGARRIPYSLVGILQYLAPTLQLLAGVFVLHEAFPLSQLIGFSFIWAALGIYAGNSLYAMRRYRQAENRA
ncbi:MAG: EamA family transporter RarD [Gammaproteobacteria bacterium HGW-Gammaproteobacteria-2]|jgi:chloramphenicol-sensitive protein RarD|nr:MAG: EamA family transporter RarD [Gammaproteobacteria bacterium HGW-Gammaproteobacteria-2]